MRERQSIPPLTPEQHEHYVNMQGFVILGLPPGGNAWQGYVEHSFSMGWSPEYVNLWWSGNAVSNFGTKHVVDGRKSAESHLAECRLKSPDWRIEIMDVRDPDLPIVCDWEGWAQSHRRDPNTLSGVTDKFRARNLKFVMREDNPTSV